MSMEFQDMIMFLQRLPTQDWDESTLASVLSQALVYRHQREHPDERRGQGLAAAGGAHGA
jgi:hypothetical protein